MQVVPKKGATNTLREMAVADLVLGQDANEVGSHEMPGFCMNVQWVMNVQLV